jgi:fused signal recognition particle receptor
MFKWFGKKSQEVLPQEVLKEAPVQSPVQTLEPEPTVPTSPEALPEATIQEQPAVEPEPAKAPLEETKTEGAFAGLRAAVSMTGKSIVGKIFGLLKDSEITDETIDEIEEILIRADVGLDTAIGITGKLRQQKDKIATTDKLMALLRLEFSEILTPYEQANHLVYQPGVMNVYLVVGVNGAGKTTFIGKLANRFIKQGKKVMIGAGDTFRAAAEEQLEIWAQRAGAGFVGAGNTKDPAAVIFEALKQARENGADVVLLDTAGRLQNKFNLMEELRKVRKVIDQGMSDNDHLESLLVLDATTGQNALKQASIFKETVDLSGVVLTKLDGSAKGGVILTIAKEHQLPVKMVGIGEGIEDLKDFNAREFIDALFEK